MLHIFVEVLKHTRIHEATRIATIDGMVLVRKQQKVAPCFLRLHFIHILDGVGEVNIVVCSARHNQQRAVAGGDMCHAGGLLVAAFVLLRGEHVPFGVDGVIVAPVGDGCHSHCRSVGCARHR